MGAAVAVRYVLVTPQPARVLRLSEAERVKLGDLYGYRVTRKHPKETL